MAASVRGPDPSNGTRGVGVAVQDQGWHAHLGQVVPEVGAGEGRHAGQRRLLAGLLAQASASRRCSCVTFSSPWAEKNVLTKPS
jgi:hypothetical protein